MRKLILIAVAVLFATGGWFVVWRSLMADDVAQVKTTLEHHYRAIKAVTPSATLKADDVYATGFPFHFRVAVHRPTLTQIWGGESYAVSFEKIELEKVNDGEGRYRVLAPAEFDAMYAVEGKAPERYRIVLSEVPAVLLRATGDSARCSPLPGAVRCEAKPTDPLISMAAQMPRKLILKVTLNEQSKQIGFDFMPMNLPLFMPIPATAAQPLQLFVGMLREAMVFQK